MFSVVENGKVVDYATDFALDDVRFCVGPMGRERVLREKVKNVHARIRGTISDLPHPANFRGWRRVGYDPYEWSTFVTLSDHEPALTAKRVIGTVVDGRARVYALAVGTL
jgi:hypothetical protein